jgi:Co/Zn/Cd efflux system component
VVEGFAVIGAALAVWLFDFGWPDIVIAAALLVLFLRSATRIFRGAWREAVPAYPRRHSG